MSQQHFGPTSNNSATGLHLLLLSVLLLFFLWYLTDISVFPFVTGKGLTPLGGRLRLYLRYFLVDPCPIVRACVYLSMSVYNFFSITICLEVSTKLYHNTVEANLPPNLLTCQFKMATRSALVLTSSHPIGHSEIHTL